MPFSRSSGRAAPSEQDHRSLRSALAKLDPWTFWSVPLEDDGADYAVLGSTGAFVLAICPLEGYVEPTRRGLRIGDVEVSGFRDLRKAARRVHHRLHEASAFVDVEPVICLTRAVAGSSRTVRGVRLVRLEDVAGEIGSRERVLDPGTAKRAAEALGRPLQAGSGPEPEPHDEEP